MIHGFCAVLGVALCALGVSGTVLDMAVGDRLHFGSSTVHNAVYIVAGLLAWMATLERRRVALRLCQGIGLTFGAIALAGLIRWDALTQLLDFGRADIAASLGIAASCFVAVRASLMREAAWRRRHQSYWAAFDDRLRGGFEEALEVSHRR